MTSYGAKYDEGKDNNMIGSDLDLSDDDDGSDMDMEEDESYASSQRLGGGGGGSYASSRGDSNELSPSVIGGNGDGGRGARKMSSASRLKLRTDNITADHRQGHQLPANAGTAAGLRGAGGFSARRQNMQIGTGNRGRGGLSLAIGSSVELGGDEAPSYDVTESVFIKGDLAINRTGVRMRDRAKTFVVDASELELAQIIGRGSSSYVQHAVHKPTGTQVALKVINMFDKGKRDQLMQEIATLYDAACPSIIGFYGAFYREGTISIALEYMDGGSLANMVHQLGPLDEPVLAHIAFQIVFALAYLKRTLRRVHRDIKPSNVLINSQGLVKLSDFGLSAELQNSIAMCATFVGTFKYMSPERIKNLTYGQSADIWSLGITLLECATGRYPYSESEYSRKLR